MLRYAIPAVLLFALLTAGCAGEMAQFASSEATKSAGSVQLVDRSESMVLPAEAGEMLQITPVAAVDRKIIYEAQVQLVTKDFDAAMKRLPEIVKEQGGYVGDFSDDVRVASQRRGTWECRVPVEKYDAFLAAILELGVRESWQQTAQDVTEEYVDLEARLSNQRKLEERILEVLAKADDKIADIIEVERELARVRGVIEQIEGRLRYLKDRISLTTVTLTIREQRDYVPPENPTLANRVSGAFGDSLDEMRRAGEGFLVGFVYAAPWLLLWAVILTPIILFIRRLFFRRKTAAG